MATRNLYGRAGANVLRAAHAEFRVTDLEAARHFYVDLLGLVETERTADSLYLRALEEREHHSLILRRAPSPGLTHMAYRVADPDDLGRLSHRFAELGLPQRWVAAGEELGQGRALRAQDPAGLPIEFYCETKNICVAIGEGHIPRMGAHDEERVARGARSDA